MSRVEWIVCERTPRWSAALRMALAAEDAAARLVEIRLLSELDAAIAGRPHAVVAIEVHAGNFAAVLNFLPAARARHTTSSFATLVDSSLAGIADCTVATLFEAGAQAVAASPRRLEGVLALGRKHGQLSASFSRGSTVLDEVWASLPWQAS
jgi:hypothetical protein